MDFDIADNEYKTHCRFYIEGSEIIKYELPVSLKPVFSIVDWKDS